MLSMIRLGRQGFGNQLFQYAFLRLFARRLGVPFYCPPWLGDRIFPLDDAAERAPLPEGLVHEYRQPDANCGYEPGALAIEDRTEVRGFFQSPRYWPDPEVVRRWFTPRPDAVAAVEQRYAHVDFARTTSLHVRFGDMEGRTLFYQPRLAYYRAALAATRAEHVLIFSDEVPKARRLFAGLRPPPGRAPTFTYAEGNAGHEDLHLMSRCRNNVCSASTFAWWGAWMNRHPDRIVIAPAEGLLRPGAPVIARDLWPEEWRRLRALRPLLDGYRARLVRQKLRWLVGR
jgi:hypothetical protein